MCVPRNILERFYLSRSPIHIKHKKLFIKNHYHILPFLIQQKQSRSRIWWTVCTHQNAENYSRAKRDLHCAIWISRSMANKHCKNNAIEQWWKIADQIQQIRNAFCPERICLLKGKEPGRCWQWACNCIRIRPEW